MYRIVKKQVLNPTVTRMDIEAPLIAKKAEPGQFIILRVDEKGERIPLTVADFDREAGTVTIIFQIVGATTEKLNHLEEEFQAVSDKFVMMTDDGSYGEKGLVTNALEKLIGEGETYDEVIAIGPLVMMKFVTQLTKQHNIKTVVSMNPIMIDGTGMCGGCRLTVGGKTKFACVDGPDFDGFEVDFDEAMARGTMYRDFERHAYEETCNLFQKEVK